MRSLILLMVLACGCSSGFKDEAEELRYLEDVASPTPTQWKRREELRTAALRRRMDAVTIDRSGELTAKQARDESARRVAEIDREARQSWLDNAAKWEKAGEPDKAVEQLRNLLRDWPDSPEAAKAKIEIRRLGGDLAP